jgi:hypothetical protein
MSGEKYYRDGDSSPCQLCLQLEPAHSRHAHIQNQAARTMWIEGLEKRTGGFVGFGAQAGRLKEQKYCSANRLVVIDHEYDRFGKRHAFGEGATLGSRTDVV